MEDTIAATGGSDPPFSPLVLLGLLSKANLAAASSNMESFNKINKSLAILLSTRNPCCLRMNATELILLKVSFSAPELRLFDERMLSTGSG